MPAAATPDLKTAIPLPMERIAEFCRKWQVIEFALFGSVLHDYLATNFGDSSGEPSA